MAIYNFKKKKKKPGKSVNTVKNSTIDGYVGGTGSMTINGVTYQGNNISVTNGRVTIDGQKQDIDTSQYINIVGNINQLACDKSVRIDGSVKEVTAAGSVVCDSVNGNIKAGGSVNCDKVGGNVTAGGSVNI